MHELVPSVVAMAVRMVMAMCRIFCQMLWLFMVLSGFSLFVDSFVGVFVFHHRVARSFTEFFFLYLLLVIQTTEGRKDLGSIRVLIHEYIHVYAS